MGDDFAVIVEDLDAVDAGAAAAADLRRLGAQLPAHAGTDEVDVRIQTDGTEAVRIGRPGKREVGEGEDRASLRNAEAVQGIFGDVHHRLRISEAQDVDPHAVVAAEPVVVVEQSLQSIHFHIRVLLLS